MGTSQIKQPMLLVADLLGEVEKEGKTGFIFKNDLLVKSESGISVTETLINRLRKSRNRAQAWIQHCMGKGQGLGENSQGGILPLLLH